MRDLLPLSCVLAILALPLGACPDCSTGNGTSNRDAGLDAAITVHRDDGGGGMDASAPDAETADAAIPDDAAMPGDAQTGWPASETTMGATLYDGGVEFRVWAPHASAASLALGGDGGTLVPMAAEDGGTFAARVDGVGAGALYHFTLEHAGKQLQRLDPRARQIAGSDSVVVDPATYAWQSSFTAPAREATVAYEMHVAGFAGATDTGAGTFAGVIGRLDHLGVLGVNAIELMPVNYFPGRGWGYNPQAYFAPNPSYGAPDDLRRLVDEAHARGIAVWLDVVFNHYDGWSGAPLHCFDGDCTGNAGIYFFPDAPYASTPWGPRPDYATPEVAAFILDSVRLWTTEYQVDGFRWDSTSNIRALDGQGSVPDGQALLQHANDLVHSLSPGALSVAEDLKGWAQLTLPTAQGGFGFDAQWDGFGYTVDGAVVGASDSARDVGSVRDAISGDYNGDPFQRLLFTEDHDVDGNGSARLPQLIDPKDPGSWAARKRSMLAAGILLTAPGVPMLFMGQEFLERGSFTDPPPPLDWTKEQSYGPVQLFYQDMIRLRRNLDGTSPALSCKGVDVFHVNDSAKVLAWRRSCPSGPSVIVVANFADKGYPRYDVGLPAGGAWHVRVNTDDTRYSTDFGGASSADVVALDATRDGLPFTGPIVLGPYSVVVLSQ